MSGACFNAEEGGHQRLYVMNADGTKRRRLSGEDDVDHLPVWSKDGKTLLFTTERGDREFIQLLDVTTGRRRTIDTGAGASAPPARKGLREGRHDVLGEVNDS